MAQARPYQAYQKTGVNTSNQKQLIIMLFDGMNKFMNQSIRAIEEEDFETAHAGLHKTGKIIMELMSTLKEEKGGEIAANLKKLYVYCYEQIVVANLKKDTAMVREVQGILGTIGEGFKEIGKQGTAMKGQTQATNQSIRITG